MQSSERAIDLSAIGSTHEEADTRLIVHCVNRVLTTQLYRQGIRITCCFLSHMPHIPCPNLYMMSGTATKRNYFNISVIYENLPAGSVSAFAAFSCLNGLRYNILHMQLATKIGLEIIPKAPHTSFLLISRGRANRTLKK